MSTTRVDSPALATALALVVEDSGIEVRLGGPWTPGFLAPDRADFGPAAQDEIAFVGGDGRVAGSRLVRGVVLVSLVAVQTALTYGFAPALGPSHVLMRPRRRRDDLAAFAIGHPGSHGSGRGGRSEVLRAVGRDAGVLLAPAIDRIRAATRLGAPAQWGLAAGLIGETCLEVLAEAGAEDDEQAAAVATVLAGDERLARRAPELRRAPDPDTGVEGLAVFPRACCLSHRWHTEPGYCWNCPLNGTERGRQER